MGSGFFDRIIVQLGKGLYWTLYLSVVGSLLSLVVGFILGILKTSSSVIIKKSIQTYVFLMRGIPFLLLIFFIYYVLPFLGIRLSAFIAGVLGLVMHEGAYMVEIVHSALEDIDIGQHESAQSLGLNYFQKMIYVILPQAIKMMLPALAGQLVLLIKQTSLISLIGLADLTRIGKQLTQRGENPFLIFTVVGIFYFVVCYPVINISNRLERRV